MIRDGPHGLVGGTTGSGKSELLRSLVAALAVHTDPEHLTFILMDFKGGAAFDECSRLPHTVGMVTDLDEALGERALEALEAEIQYRERLLRSVSADNLHEYLALNPAEPLPRLLVVIDEFATMAKEFPEFLSALVSVAQRGRTLGVHMLLATQRPSGAVNENIKTNTNLRIALRVQDGEDSIDVIGRRDAAELSRHRPGRAYIRLGPGEIVPIQTALVTCVTDERTDAAVDVSPFVFGPAAQDGARSAPAAGDDGAPAPTDLARLVDAIVAANADAGLAPARRPWPEPLGEQLDLGELLAGAQEAGRARPVVALADDPRRQRQYPVGWDLAEGNLLLLGIPGSGTTTTLSSLVLSLATVLSPDELEVYALDFGAGDLAPLERLPHTGSVILAADRERQMRLIRHLRSELDRRRIEGPGRRIVVAIDNLAAMRSEFDDIEGLELMDVLTRVYADGRESGIWFAVSADRLNVIPSAWSAITTQKWLFRLPDAYDYVTAGLTRKHVPAALPGRAVMAETGLQIQVARAMPTVADAVDAIARRHPAAGRRAARIDVLPAELPFAALPGASALDAEPWRIAYGVRESDLGTAELVLYEGDHALVTGPARSGKSSTLLTLVESLRGAPGGAALHLAATGGRRSPLAGCAALDRYAPAGGEATAMFATLRAQAGPVVLLIDDAEQFDDGDGAIAGLLSAGRPDLHVIAAGRSDTLRAVLRPLGAQGAGRCEDRHPAAPEHRPRRRPARREPPAPRTGADGRRPRVRRAQRRRRDRPGRAAVGAARRTSAVARVPGSADRAVSHADHPELERRSSRWVTSSGRPMSSASRSRPAIDVIVGCGSRDRRDRRSSHQRVDGLVALVHVDDPSRMMGRFVHDANDVACGCQASAAGGSGGVDADPTYVTAGSRSTHGSQSVSEKISRYRPPVM